MICGGFDRATARARRAFIRRATATANVRANPTAIVEHLRSMDTYYKSKLRELVEVNSYTENAEGIARVAQLTRKLFEPLGFYEVC